MSKSGMAKSALRPGLLRDGPVSYVGSPDQVHHGLVTCIATCQTPSTVTAPGGPLVATAATDGLVKIWHIEGGCIWTSDDSMRSENGRIDDPCTIEVECSSEEISILVGCQSGTVHSWQISLKTLEKGSHSIITRPVNQSNGASKPVQLFIRDTQDSSILVLLDGDSKFRKYWHAGTLEASVSTFGHSDDDTGSLTCLKYSFTNSSTHTNTFGNLNIVLGADTLGRIFIWDWHKSSINAEVVLPFRQLQSFEAKVTALDLTDVNILAGRYVICRVNWLMLT